MLKSEWLCPSFL